MKFEVDEKLVAPIIRDQIAAAVVAQLGNTDELVRKMVHLALTQKVGSEGVPAQYSSDNRYDFVEAVAAKTIRDAARSAIQQLVEAQAPAIQKAIETELKRAPKQTAAAIISAFVDSAKNPYTLRCDFHFAPRS